MSLRPRWISTALLMALLCAACSSTQSTEPTDTTEQTSATIAANTTHTTETPKAPDLSCENDKDKIIELLHPGWLADYDGAADLGALIDSVDLVLWGEIASIERGNRGTGDETIITMRSPTVLHASGYQPEPVEVFSYDSLWQAGAGVDPLATPVTVEGVSFVAFLDSWETATGGFEVNIQGLFISCGEDEVPTPAIEPLPIDAAELTFRELLEAIE